MPEQMPLIPVSQGELNQSAYRLALLLQERDEAADSFAEVKKSYKEHLGALDREIREHRFLIRRAQVEAEEGLMGEQIEALLQHEQERTDGPREDRP